MRSMPTYVYEEREHGRGCAFCRAGFEVRQSLDEPRLERCPKCRGPVMRVIQAPGLAHSQTDLHYRARRAGFHTLRRVDGGGAYEKLY